MSGKTVRKKSPFGETYGFINMNSKAEMQLTSSGDAYGFAADTEETGEAFCTAAEE